MTVMCCIWERMDCGSCCVEFVSAFSTATTIKDAGVRSDFRARHLDGSCITSYHVMLQIIMLLYLRTQLQVQFIARMGLQDM
jgi:hypothetical protein